MITHPEGLPQQPFSVIGCWGDGERYAAVYSAPSARGAEDIAQMDARDKGGTLWVARVVAGQAEPADNYTAYIDPADSRNADVDGLEEDVPDFAAGDPEWTVIGLAVPKGTPLGDPHIGVTGERYADVVNATSAGAAEDVARSRLADKGGDLWVCTVLPGRVRAVDSYATFADPDAKPRT